MSEINLDESEKLWAHVVIVAVVIWMFIYCLVKFGPDIPR